MHQMTAAEYWKCRTPMWIKVFVIGGGAVCFLMGLMTLVTVGFLGSLDAILMLGLGYGIVWRRSRACAVAAAAYYAVNQLLIRLLPFPVEQSAAASAIVYVLIGLLVLSIYGTFTFRSQFDEYRAKSELPPPDQEGL